MFDGKKMSKIKNDKIMRWRMELSSYQFDIIHKAGKLNLAADAMSRNVSCCSVYPNTDKLMNLHESLCHPGVTRMMHFVRVKNLPYSMEDVKKITSSCSDCAKLKPSFYKPGKVTLIKATQPFERLNIDFKGPLPSNSKNRYILTVIDEYSRFPFAFACSDISSQTVITCLTQLFSIFGMPAYVHSDKGTAFMSNEFLSFLTDKGISKSQTTPYNPTGNSQCERYNGIIWKTVMLALKNKRLPNSYSLGSCVI